MTFRMARCAATFAPAYLGLRSRCLRAAVPISPKFKFSTQGSEEAFWEVEGSTVVDKSQSGSLEYLACSRNLQDRKKLDTMKGPSEVVRLTQFGHIRLDQENPVQLDEDPQGQQAEALNFIDNQFFGDHFSNTPHLNPATSPGLKASDVPVDTNPIDQQYFYPKATDEGESVLQAGESVPSASELEFHNNEVDHQYFGSTRRLQQEANPSKVSALDYLRSLNAEGDADKASPGLASGKTDAGNAVARTTHAQLIPDWRKLPNEVICSILKKSILFNRDGIVALNKPYGIVTTDVDGNSHIVLTAYLPMLSQMLKCEKLYTVHRLDRDTTGVLLLASSQAMANQLNQLFSDRKITKKYLAITKGVPEPQSGTIDIPLCERNIGKRQRMTLRPVKSHGEDPRSGQYNTKVKSFRAVTHFKTLSQANSAGLVELQPDTGVRHQLRVHLSEAINCPVLGDHKYSHDDKLAPQKLPQSILERLGIRQSKVRNLPMHLHASSVCIPELGDGGKDLVIKAELPAFFRLSMKRLKLTSSRSAIKKPAIG